MTNEVVPLQIEIDPRYLIYSGPMWEIHPNYPDKYSSYRYNEQHIFSFPNNYGASIIRGYGTLGHAKGLYELSMGKDFCLTTPSISKPHGIDFIPVRNVALEKLDKYGVAGFLDIDGVAMLLLQIYKLPSVAELENRNA